MVPQPILPVPTQREPFQTIVILPSQDALQDSFVIVAVNSIGKRLGQQVLSTPPDEDELDEGEDELLLAC